MSVTVTAANHWSDTKRIHVIGTITPTGNYPANGDVINFIVAGVKSSSTPLYVEIHGNTGYLYSYVLSSGKLSVVSTASGVDIGAVPYPAAILADVITFHAIFKKFE